MEEGATIVMRADIGRNLRSLTVDTCNVLSGWETRDTRNLVVLLGGALEGMTRLCRLHISFSDCEGEMVTMLSERTFAPQLVEFGTNVDPAAGTGLDGFWNSHQAIRTFASLRCVHRYAPPHPLPQLTCVHITTSMQSSIICGSPVKEINLATLDNNGDGHLTFISNLHQSTTFIERFTFGFELEREAETGDIHRCLSVLADLPHLTYLRIDVGSLTNWVDECIHAVNGLSRLVELQWWDAYGNWNRPSGPPDNMPTPDHWSFGCPSLRKVTSGVIARHISAVYERNGADTPWMLVKPYEDRR